MIGWCKEHLSLKKTEWKKINQKFYAVRRNILRIEDRRKGCGSPGAKGI